jgi:hypothetical protein
MGRIIAIVFFCILVCIILILFGVAEPPYLEESNIRGKGEIVSFEKSSFTYYWRSGKQSRYIKIPATRVGFADESWVLIPEGDEKESGKVRILAKGNTKTGYYVTAKDKCK